jgi:ABC-type dipeptide/oligopeptide/nickel transport system permease subunit
MDVPAVGRKDGTPEYSWWKDSWRHFAKNRLALVGLVILLALVFVAIFAPWLAPYDPAEQHLPDKRTPPGAKYLLGADEYGRDILSRMLFGARVALLVGVLAVTIALAIGLVLGTLAGYMGGYIDELVMRATDILLAFPYLLLAIAIVTALGASATNTTLAVGIWGAPSFIRLVRGSVISLREREFIQAARALGASTLRIMAWHLVPNFLAPVVVFATLFMARAILVEAALSFLGLGIQPPDPSWGLMVSSGRNFITIAPHISTVPGLGIVLAVLGFNLVGDGLRDALDPKMRNVG